MLIRWFVRRFVIDDEILLMNRNNGYLLALNDVSTYVLDMMKERHDEHDVAACIQLDRLHKHLIWLMEMRSDRSDLGR